MGEKQKRNITSCDKDVLVAARVRGRPRSDVVNLAVDRDPRALRRVVLRDLLPRVRLCAHRVLIRKK